MPLDKRIKKTLLIGSGPIVIGQAAEFDYAGTQALRALKEEGVEVVLVNSNPATIMTDQAMADKIYIEPLTLTTVKRIIAKEKPDSLLSGLGGQTGLTLSMQLAREGFLDQYGVRVLGTTAKAIDQAEDRQMFKDAMAAIHQPTIPSAVTEDLAEAVTIAQDIGYPVIVRPAFTLGGSGGGIAGTEDEFREVAQNGLMQSPIHQILVEKCISGWKEIEFEVMRDSRDNVITVCSMENFDPVGVHTGDSIVIAPAVTLADKEYQMLRTAACTIISALGVEGGCNCQFALHPHSFEYAVIEVNPRVSRSSALASKATGYPIAKVAAKIALGYTLDEIVNAVTGNTFAAFEPTLDYVAVKFPKWPFDKFVYAKRELGTQMKATGEVMAIAENFEMAIMKAVRGAEIGLDSLNLPRLKKVPDGDLRLQMQHPTDERIFVVYAALQRGFTVDEIHELTAIDRWFLYKLEHLAHYEAELERFGLDEARYLTGKQWGYPDQALKRISGSKNLPGAYRRIYRMVDTCGGEFPAETPYFYSGFAGDNEAAEWTAGASTQEKVVVLGSGPIRIGQGIEFDYASVHCVWALKKLGYEVIIINNNPETVSTDFDTADRLYFEPLTAEDVMDIILLEKPVGVIVAFGGQTAIKLTQFLHQQGVRIIGTSADSIDMAEDRERFDQLLENLNIKRPQGFTVMTVEEALSAANTLSYPVLLRPSYVLGGQNMIIAFGDEDIVEYMAIIFSQKQDNPVLVDKYLSGAEVEVDAISDGVDVLIPGIMEHIERTGIHSGDSIAVYPAPHIDDALADKIYLTTRQLCAGLQVQGIINLQYIILPDGELYVIEVNPRASRTVPYLSKVTGVPMVELATRVSLGEKLSDLGYSGGVYRPSPYTAVKVPVFSFAKLIDVDTQLGPEMKSTGEVLGIGKNLEEALYKGLIAAGYTLLKKGSVFISVRDGEKTEIADIAKKYDRLGFTLYATRGTAEVLQRAGLTVQLVNKIHEAADNVMTLLESGIINYIISTSSKGRNPERDSVKIRRKASLLGIPCLTSLDTANAVADILTSRCSESNTELVDINRMRSEKMKIPFIKMHGCGNDYIYIDCLNREIDAPESLSIFLADRHFGVGGDGLVLICPSEVADAKMRMFNLDGSEGKMCGNAIRCVAKYLYDNDIVRKLQMSIETLSGIRKLELMTRYGQVFRATVDMGPAELKPELIPVRLDGDPIVSRLVRITGEPLVSEPESRRLASVNGDFAITCVSMGNPHCVVFVPDVDHFDVAYYGPRFENDPLFPERVNIEFVQLVDDRTIRMRVWERGSGETLACGTGACAAAVAAVLNGHCQKGEDIRVILTGGELVINYTEERVLMSGPAEKVFDGVVEI